MATKKKATRRKVAPAKSSKKKSTLKRPLQPMPADIRRLLVSRDAEKAYRSRPPYQQNDYLAWIARAKLPATRNKRIEQMLDELDRGDVYMKMRW